MVWLTKKYQIEANLIIERDGELKLRAQYPRYDELMIH